MKTTARIVRKVLLVDDEPVQLALWERDLRALPVELIRASDHKTAVELARAQRPELAIVDLVLGSDSGLDVIEELHRLDPGMYLHLASARLGYINACAAIQRGAADVSPKPVDAAAIVKQASGQRLDPSNDPYPSFEDAQRAFLERALRDFDFNLAQTAEALELTETSLRRKIERLRVYLPAAGDPMRPGQRRARALASHRPRKPHVSTQRL